MALALAFARVLLVSLAKAPLYSDGAALDLDRALAALADLDARPPLYSVGAALDLDALRPRLRLRSDTSPPW